ncbi:hypothetical protein CDAR_10941 [Caerostris darwini]|uniref:Beta-lactamase-related domain-containing protein n=1 Tax=Caerostris darwini TaxID=1538125 RepID=A0AAV4W649_9ARAC|nr:hypothetical protein CDAR_10941 [Caerostris darwini]
MKDFYEALRATSRANIIYLSDILTEILRKKDIVNMEQNVILPDKSLGRHWGWGGVGMAPNGNTIPGQFHTYIDPGTGIGFESSPISKDLTLS